MTGGVPRAFLDHIVANPDDDVPRLAYADWLDENGLADRAEFIRVQCERARLPDWDAAQVRLRLREQERIARHGEEWLAEVPAVEGSRWEGFRRGVVAEVSFASFEAMRTHAHACRAAAPVEAVTVRWPRRREVQQDPPPIAELRELTLTGRPDGEPEVARLAGSPQLATLRSLTAGGLWADGLRRLVRSPHLARLAAFRLPGNRLGPDGILTLVRAGSLTALEELDLSGHGVGDGYGVDPDSRPAGMEALAAWSGLASVRSLDLSGNHLGRPGLRALLRSPHAAGLKRLSVRRTELDGQAMAEFADVKSGLSLDVLDVGENLLKDLGAEYVALAKCLRDLKVLRLDRCEVTQDGARLFAKKAACLNGLRVLDLGHNHVRRAGLAALLDRKPPLLHTLGLRDNDLGDAGAEVLAESPASDTLVELDLTLNQLGASAADALGRSPHLRSLLVLRCEGNPMPWEVTEALRASPLGRRLTSLGIGPCSDIPF